MLAHMACLSLLLLRTYSALPEVCALLSRLVPPRKRAEEKLVLAGALQSLCIWRIYPRMKQDLQTLSAAAPKGHVQPCSTKGDLGDVAPGDTTYVAPCSTQNKKDTFSSQKKNEDWTADAQQAFGWCS